MSRSEELEALALKLVTLLASASAPPLSSSTVLQEASTGPNATQPNTSILSANAVKEAARPAIPLFNGGVSTHTLGQTVLAPIPPATPVPSTSQREIRLEDIAPYLGVPIVNELFQGYLTAKTVQYELTHALLKAQADGHTLEREVEMLRARESQLLATASNCSLLSPPDAYIRNTSSLGPDHSASRTTAAHISSSNGSHPIAPPAELEVRSSVRPPQYPETVLWLFEDAKVDPDSRSPSKGNESRIRLHNAIRDVNGDVVSRSVYNSMLSTAQSHMDQILAKPDVVRANISLRYQRPFFQRFSHHITDAVRELERSEPLLRLCGTHWKAERLLGKALTMARTASGSRSDNEGSDDDRDRANASSDPSSSRSVPVSQCSRSNSHKRGIDTEDQAAAPRAAKHRKSTLAASSHVSTLHANTSPTEHSPHLIDSNAPVGDFADKMWKAVRGPVSIPTPPANPQSPPTPAGDGDAETYHESAASTSNADGNTQMEATSEDGGQTIPSSLSGITNEGDGVSVCYT